jgi:hypothetical protein
MAASDTHFLPDSVLVASLTTERAGYVAQLPKRPEVQARIDACDAELARLTGGKGGRSGPKAKGSEDPSA